MPRAPLPPNEPQRLNALRAYELLDTEPELAFDAVTNLAATLFDVPIALVSLIDEHRQWFKSNRGLVGTDSTERDVAFCSHAILQNDILEVPDATQDDRFADNPLVVGAPFIRFYAGMPLIDGDGIALGTLCIIDRRPRVLTAVQQEQLRSLAQATVGVITLRIRASEEQAEGHAVTCDPQPAVTLRRRKKLLQRFARRVNLADDLAHIAQRADDSQTG